MITIEKKQKMYQHRFQHLVRGYGKRAVVVVMHPFHIVEWRMEEEDLIKLAALEASKRGWKKVIVHPDNLYGEEAEIFNLAMCIDVWKGHRYGGITIGYVGDSGMANG
jgi:hypothetical protein